MSEKKYIDFATVRDLLQAANDSREEHREQQMAMEYAERVRSTNRGGSATSSKVHGQLHEALGDVDSIADNDFIRSKIVEIRPQTLAEIRVIASIQDSSQ